MLYASLVASVDAVLKLITGDTVTRELIENFELLDIPNDLYDDMLRVKDIDMAIEIYTLWVNSLEPIQMRLSTMDHYLGDPEGPIDTNSFSLTTFQEAHLKMLDEWLRLHRGWLFQFKTEEINDH